MKSKGVWIGAFVVTVLAAVWYYRKRSDEIAKAQMNPNASVNEALGSLAGSYTDRTTGPNGDTYINNDRYATYRQFLQVGGLNSGSTFDQYLTASQGQSLPMNS